MMNPFDFNLYFEQLEERIQAKKLTTVEIIQNNGYTAEVHNVITEDGYILELHRIPMSKNGEKPTRNHPVFFHHGILGSSADFVLGGAKISLPMQLADAGYDVWLTNCRGNTYSEKHVSMTSEQNDFWNFSKHEIGVYDLPASIDYVLINTKAQQLHYIGYSMGSCVFFIMASERPEYQPKIRSQISLAPIAYLSNMRSYLKYIVPYAKIIDIVIQKISKGIIFPQSRLQKLMTSVLCSQKVTQKLIYEKGIIFSICGNDPYHFDSKLIPTIMKHVPAGTSSKLFLHFAQITLKNIFSQYDYGPVMNLQYYNSTCPPTYDLKSNQVPTTLIYAENDMLAVEKDVMRLKHQLPNLMDAFPVNCPYFNHVDFLWSVDVMKQINEPVKGILEKTDDSNWKYLRLNSKMSPPESEIDDRHVPCTTPAEERPPSLLYFIPILDYFIEKFNLINVRIMPQLMAIKDHWW